MKNFKIIASVLAVLALILAVGTAYSCDLSILSFTAASAIKAGAPLALYERKVFEQLRADKRYKGMVISPSYLRIQSKLSNSSGSYSIDIKKNGNELTTELKLDRNDTFVATRLGIYLLKRDTTKDGLGQLQTYPNTTVFASATGFTPAHLETIYNGNLNMKVNQTVVIEKMPLSKFRYVPTSQQTATIIYSEWNDDNAALTLPALWILNGTDSVELTVNFPTYSGIQIAAVATNTENHLVVVPFGFLIKNGAPGAR